MVKVISFESNISCGKSTLIENVIKAVVDDPRYMVVPEPVDQWKTIMVNDQNILEAFYNDMATVALPFQLIALITRRQLFLEKIKEAEKIESETGKEVILITERTITSDRYIFAKMLNKDGFISDAGMVAYNLWNDIFSKEISTDKIIYINIPPEICLERVRQRNRKGEDKITLEYLQDCQNAHDEFYEDHIRHSDHKVVDTTIALLGTKEYDDLIRDIIDYINN